MTENALDTRGTKPPDIKKPYLKDTTIALLRLRDEALAQGHQAQSKLLTTQFRHQVKKDRKEAIQEQLRTFPRHQQNWPAIKNLRRTSIPRFSKRGLPRGHSWHRSQRLCQILRNRTLETKTKGDYHLTTPPPFYETAHEEGKFTLEELNEAIDTLKPNKAGGTDNIITELMKDLDAHNRTELLRLYNDIYHMESRPDHFNEAMVVQIYKTGKTPEFYSSYRPIALSNITYKLLAKVCYSRGRSTAESIFLTCRIQELDQRHGTQLYMLALDYSKAFDSIPPQKVFRMPQPHECPSENGFPGQGHVHVPQIWNQDTRRNWR